MNNTLSISDSISGSMLGGAVGDALGYEVEFLGLSAIRNRFGKDGITRYVLNQQGVARISDDTQMSLYTACGLLNAISHGVSLNETKEVATKYVWPAYKEWAYLQNYGPSTTPTICEITIAEGEVMASNRAPGCTCMSALNGNTPGTLSHRLNNSKGCGTVMRVAPIALINDDAFGVDARIQLAIETSVLTHGHDLGFLPSALMTEIIYQTVYNRRAHSDLGAIVEYSVLTFEKKYSEKYSTASSLVSLVNKALSLATSDDKTEDSQDVATIGEGWVADEALAIAIYCCVKHQDDFEQAIVAAVNHSGDSDSTGAVAGNILGAYLGVTAIPKHFLENLEIKSSIEALATKLS